MMATRFIVLLMALIFIGCNKDDDRAYSNDAGRFVRFNLQVDNNGTPIEFPDVAPSEDRVSNFDNSTFKTLKIPVSITSTPLALPVQIDFTAVLEGMTQVSIEPASAILTLGSRFGLGHVDGSPLPYFCLKPSMGLYSFCASVLQETIATVRLAALKILK